MPIDIPPPRNHRHTTPPRRTHPERIQDILTHPKVWRGSFLAQKNDRRQATSNLLPSGFPQLDHHLGGGWPLGQLTELSYGATGVGELALILPALAQRCAQGDHTLAWIHPKQVITPYPNPHALLAQGIRLKGLLWMTPKTLTDALWAAEQCVSSPGCNTTLLCLPQTRTRRYFIEHCKSYKLPRSAHKTGR